jgi:hypothetical protein
MSFRPTHEDILGLNSPGVLLMEMGESRPPRMSFAPVRRHAPPPILSGFLLLRSSPVVALIHSHWGLARAAHRH